MIEVKFYLYDRTERDILNEALDKIAERRLRSPELRDKIAIEPLPQSAQPAVEPNATPIFDNVADAGRYYNKTHGLAKTVELLARFGVKRVTDLPEDRHAEFLAAVSA